MSGTDYDLVLSSARRVVRGVISGVGGAVRCLSVDGIDLTPGFDRGRPAPFYCGKVLAPWPNRVRDGRWHHDGRTLQLDITDPETNTALHGFLCAAEYECVAHSESSVTLAAPIQARDGYPFDLATAVRYQLTTTGLTSTHTVRNIGSRCAPVALGAHPFLSIGGVPADQLTLTVDGDFHVDLDDQRIPVGVTPVSGTAWDLRTGRSVADLTLDDCWVVSGDTGGGSTHTLRSPDGRTLSLWADAGFGFLHVFVTRAFPKGGDLVTAVALEPMTAQADALNSGIGLRWLAPREQFSASWAIRYEHSGNTSIASRPVGIS
ncbi:aldose 1-epimerase family protein [Mycolicibacterium sp. BiH015]|uniref:aldose 1-epimerase family protein n=1 Tax=Mycolicibacterium sp. BiH015 TaxID=3018808 RepID=UPI0022E7F2BD|nr:aldose 1-epimerase family protein [Mycolicibacterium sp. BiH015]MDA2892187.1 aldose 1-epimerase family protein [Mycolicibacterium sp. BiH015]